MSAQLRTLVKIFPDSNFLGEQLNKPGNRAYRLNFLSSDSMTSLGSCDLHWRSTLLCNCTK